MSTLVMHYDGTTARGPMALPRDAQRRLDDGGTVSNLAGADWQTRNACGYYEAVRAVADDGMVITDSVWPPSPSNGVFRQVVVFEITQADYDAQQAAAALAEHDAAAPAGNLSTWSKREKCLLLITYKLAKLHAPNLTRPKFLTQVKAEWDSLK